MLLEQDCWLLRGKRVGLVTNQTGVNSRLESIVDLFFQDENVDLRVLMGPEHGIRGEIQAGVHINNYVDSITGLKVFSLFGKTYIPTGEMLKDVDVVVFDIQDAGVRFFTYITTLAYVMEACYRHQVEVVVLDRPNPINGTRVSGPVLEPEFRSFVGYHRIALRHGMTVGELAQLYKGEFGVDCALTVVPMEGWHRRMWYDETGLIWVHPAPNAATLDILTVYPGVCFFEGTNVSEGRGTTRAFQVAGAPWADAYQLAEELNSMKLPGTIFRPTYFVPTFSKYEGELCQGIQVHYTDRNVFDPVMAGLAAVATFRWLYPEKFAWRYDEKRERYFFDLLVGTDKVRNAIDKGESLSNIEASWQEELQRFRSIRQGYLLYA